MNRFKQGQIVIVNLDPIAGHEQGGKRPAVVISNNIKNQYDNMIMVCPITSHDKKHPFHIRLDSRTRTQGVILCNHIRSLDLNARGAYVVDDLPPDILEEVITMIKQFIE